MLRKIIFSFDIPRDKSSFRVKIWRELKRLDAQKSLGSFWTLKNSNSNLKVLETLAEEIIANGGKAEIMEGRTIWKKSMC